MTCILRALFWWRWRKDIWRFYCARSEVTISWGTSNIEFFSDDADAVECQVCLLIERKCEEMFEKHVNSVFYKVVVSSDNMMTRMRVFEVALWQLFMEGNTSVINCVLVSPFITSHDAEPVFKFLWNFCKFLSHCNRCSATITMPHLQCNTCTMQGTIVLKWRIIKN